MIGSQGLFRDPEPVTLKKIIGNSMINIFLKLNASAINHEYKYGYHHIINLIREEEYVICMHALYFSTNFTEILRN